MTIQKKNRIYFIFFWGVAFILLLIRSFFSFNEADESFYITSAASLYRGDRFVLDTESMCFLFGIFELPFLFVYRMLHTDNTGIVLYFRVIYLLVSFAIAMYTAKVLKRERIRQSLICLIVVWILYFKKENVEGMSYHMISCLTFFTSLIAMIDHREIIAGLLISAAVICNPYLALIAFFVFVYLMISRKRKEAILYFGGIMIASTVFLVWIVSKQDFFLTIRNMGYLFNEAGSHMVSTPVERVKSWIYMMYSNHRLLIIPHIIVVVILIFFKLKSKTLSPRIETILIVYYSVITGYYMVIRAMSPGTIAETAVIYFFIVIMIKKSWKELFENKDFFAVLLYGAGMSLCWHMASNTWDAYRMGFGVILVGLGQIDSKCDEVRHKEKADPVLQRVETGIDTGIIVLAAICMIICRILVVFRSGSDNILTMDTKIEAGPAKGLYVSEDQATHYYEELEILETIQSQLCVSPTDRIYIETEDIWDYLIFDARCGTVYTWRVDIHDPTLVSYYERHELPDYVILDRDAKGSVMGEIMEKNSYTMNIIKGKMVYSKL